MQGNLKPGKLLDENGHLCESGWSTSLIKEYKRSDIKANKLRIKEWDYYIITNGDIAIALTFAENSYMSLASCSFLDFSKPTYKTTSDIKFFTLGKNIMPSSTESGDIIYKSNKVELKFENDSKVRHLYCKFKKFDKINNSYVDLETNLELTDFPKDKMVIASSWDEDKQSFYYNSKINCMSASGYVIIGNTRYEFDKKNSLGTLDWGRGVWTRVNTWYWGSMQTYLDDGTKFGFNIGYGFSNRKNGSENMIFVNGIAHKFDEVVFHIPTKNNKDDYLSPWTFTSNDNKFNMTFNPIIDRSDITDLGIIASKQHQVFGLFSGTVVLDDGSIIEINDKLGFAEKVYNKW
jgi:hypothetical protein